MSDYLPYQIVPMQLAHIPDVLRIEEGASLDGWNEAGYRQELETNPQAFYFVLYQGGRLIGHVGHWMIADEAHISTITIDKPFQRRGLGELLLLHTLRQAHRQNAILVTLEVRQHNLPAQALYHKWGFRIVGRRRNYYKATGEDAILMTIEPLDDAFCHRLDQLEELLMRRLSENDV